MADLAIPPQGRAEAQLIVSTSQLIQQLTSSITSSDNAMNNK
jgi:hypothetical protein